MQFEPPFEKAPPTERRTKFVRVVPGAPVPAPNAFDVAQALSWIASQRPDPEERIKWMDQIPKLMRELPGKSKAALN